MWSRGRRGLRHDGGMNRAEGPVIAPRVRRRQRLRNALQGLALLTGMVLVFAVIAWLFFGGTGLITVVVAGVVMGLLRPRVSPGWVLRMYGARPLPVQATPDLHRAVAQLAHRAGLRRAPRIYYVASPLANAFATGTRDDAAIALTDGILRLLTGRQLVGVLAHEISHIRSGDTRIMNVSDAIARMTHALAYFGIWLVPLTLPLTFAGDLRPLFTGLALTVLPLVTTLLQLGLSRSREYDADLAAAALTGDPEGLAAGLEVLERAEGGIWERLMVPRRRSPDPTLLRSHPPTDERVRRLRALTPGAREPLGGATPQPPTGYPPIPGPPRLRPPGIRW